MEKKIEKVYLLWKTQFVKATNFSQPLTIEQIVNFKSRPELSEIAKYSENQIKLAMYSAYLNKTAKLKNILEILKKNNPEVQNSQKIGFQLAKEKNYAKQKIFDSANLKKKQKKVAKHSLKPKANKFAYEEFKKERRWREKQLNNIALIQEKADLKKKEQLFKEQQEKIKEFQQNAENEKKINFEKFGKSLTNEEIKRLFDNKPKGWKEAFENRFSNSPQDKSYS